jgi:ketosteroid isomerase-like protein
VLLQPGRGLEAPASQPALSSRRYASDDLACVVEVERGRSKVGGGEELVPVAVRVTSLFRLEHGTWKLVHRHADPITTPRPAASVIER